MSLYLSEPEIAAEVLGKGRVNQWRALAIILEREGLPRIDPQMGGRYWPAVKTFFDKRAGLATMAPPTVPDGRESWDSKPKRQASRAEKEPMASASIIGLHQRRT